MVLFKGDLTAEDVYRLVRHGYQRPNRIQARMSRQNLPGALHQLPGLSDEAIALVERKRGYWTWVELCDAHKCEPRGLVERLGETQDR
jgi:hypothetical protein